MSQYTAIAIFHHPDGVLLPGESADLTAEAAERGLLAGTIALDPELASTVHQVVEIEPETPEVVDIDPATETQE